MHRRPLLDLLDRYVDAHPDERATVERMQRFIRAHSDCFERTCLPGHVTGSAWVISADHRHVLLTHHARFGRWLQLGGHADGETDPFEAALREAREESGMHEFRELSGGRVPAPLDLDVHAIPAHGATREHFHFDVRYLLIAAPGQSLVRSDESNDLRWVPAGRVEELSNEESLLRLARKARVLLRSP